MEYFFREFENWGLPIISVVAAILTALTGIYSLTKNSCQELLSIASRHYSLFSQKAHKNQ